MAPRAARSPANPLRGRVISGNAQKTSHTFRRRFVTAQRRRSGPLFYVLAAPALAAHPANLPELAGDFTHGIPAAVGHAKRIRNASCASCERCFGCRIAPTLDTKD